MIFSPSTAIIAVLTASASANVDVSEVVIDESKISVVTPSKNGAVSGIEGKWFGMASLKPDYVAYLKYAAGVNNPFSDDIGKNTLVQTSYLTSSSHFHRDHTTPGLYDDVRLGGTVGFFPKGSPPVPGGDRVGIIPLETSPNAYFEVDELCVSLEEGKLIQFDGSHLHRTVVNSGSVSMLGPFHFKTMANVWGIGCPDDPICGDAYPDACGQEVAVGGLCDEDCTYEDGGVCYPGCVYHRSSPGKANSNVCMCISCESTCGVGDNIFNNPGHGQSSKKPPLVGYPGGGSSACHTGWDANPCVVPSSGRTRARQLGNMEIPVHEDLPMDDVIETISSLKEAGASANATFSYQHDLISKKSCDALVHYVSDSFANDFASGKELPIYRPSKAASRGKERHYESWYDLDDGGVNSVYGKSLTAVDLVSIIGREESLKLIEFFEESLGGLTIDCMHLNRFDEEFHTVPWHKDDYATVEVTLNDDYDGGDVIHLDGDGIHKTYARPGTATAHKDDSVHGVTRNLGGPKYMLILKHHFNRPDKEGVTKLSKDMVEKL